MSNLTQNTNDLQAILEIVNALPDHVNDAVRYSEQTLTDEQKAQVRENIGAANSQTIQLSNVDLNTVTENGIYSYTTSAGITNSPKDYASILVVETYHSSDRCKQTVTLMDGHNTTIIRSYYDGSWNSWEYVNPPMVLNTEYRTTERWQGKPVYQYLIKMDSIPAGTTSSSGLKQTELASGMWTSIVDLQVTWVRPSLTTSGNVLAVNGAVAGFAYVASNNVCIKTYDNISDATVYARLKYVKN